MDRPVVDVAVLVSIHAPTWGATAQQRHTERLSGFQSTRPRGARLHGLWIRRTHRQSFNPRAHVGRDNNVRIFGPSIAVSIHAPTWGATTFSFNPRAHVGRDRVETDLFPFIQVSIHAPTWGATATAAKTTAQEKVSIHAPTWGATQSHRKQGDGRAVSIHAPTWGATDSRKKQQHKKKFQSTRPRGARPIWLFIVVGINRFQSTRPRGARPNHLLA